MSFFEKWNPGFSNFIVKKLFAPIFFFEKKSSPPYFFRKKVFAPCRWSRHGYPINFEPSLRKYYVNLFVCVLVFEFIYSWFWLKINILPASRLVYKSQNLSNFKSVWLMQSSWNLDRIITMINGTFPTNFIKIRLQPKQLWFSDSATQKYVKKI